MTAERSSGFRGAAVKAACVEAPLIGALGVVAIAASFAVAPGRLGFVGSALAALMLAIAAIDRRRFIIPDQLNALAFVAGLIALGLNGEIFGDAFAAQALTNALLRAAVMFAVFFAFRAGYRRLRGREGMGLGDVKLAAVAGVWLDWTDLPIAVDIAALSALASVLVTRALGKEWKPTQKLPFGLFLAPAIWTCWLLATWRGGWGLT